MCIMRSSVVSHKQPYNRGIHMKEHTNNIDNIMLSLLGAKENVVNLETLLTFSPARSTLEAPLLWSWRRCPWMLSSSPMTMRV